MKPSCLVGSIVIGLLCPAMTQQAQPPRVIDDEIFAQALVAPGGLTRLPGLKELRSAKVRIFDWLPWRKAASENESSARQGTVPIAEWVSAAEILFATRGTAEYRALLAYLEHKLGLLEQDPSLEAWRDYVRRIPFQFRDPRRKLFSQLHELAPRKMPDSASTGQPRQKSELLSAG